MGPCSSDGVPEHSHITHPAAWLKALAAGKHGAALPDPAWPPTVCLPPCCLPAACPEWGAKAQAVTSADRQAAPTHVFSELTPAEYQAGAETPAHASCPPQETPCTAQGLLTAALPASRLYCTCHSSCTQPYTWWRPHWAVCLHSVLHPAVYSFLLAQKSLGLTDVAKATITEDAVRLNYVHGIWYQVSTLGGGGRRAAVVTDTTRNRQAAGLSFTPVKQRCNRLLLLSPLLPPPLPLAAATLLAAAAAAAASRCRPSLPCWLT